MEQKSRWVLVAVMTLVFIAGLTVVQQSHDTVKGLATGLSMAVIAIVFVFYSIYAALGGGNSHSRR